VTDITNQFDRTNKKEYTQFICKPERVFTPPEFTGKLNISFGAG
jgi:hypothetical protein